MSAQDEHDPARRCAGAPRAGAADLRGPHSAGGRRGRRRDRVPPRLAAPAARAPSCRCRRTRARSSCSTCRRASRPTRTRGSAATLAALSHSRGRVGLVVFSDLAYEALPPGVPASDLTPFVRYFTLRHKRRPAPHRHSRRTRGRTRSAPARGSRPAWSSRTRSPRREPHAPTVMLVSDLDDDPQDLTALAAVMAAYRRDHIPVRVVGLNASPQDVTLFERFLGRAVPVDAGADARQGAAARRHTPSRGMSLALALVAAVALALRELWAPRLDWSSVMNARWRSACSLVAARLRALLAVDVRSWPTALTQRRRGLRATPPARRGAVDATRGLGARAARRRAMTSRPRRALRLYRIAQSTPNRGSTTASRWRRCARRPTDSLAQSRGRPSDAVAGATRCSASSRSASPHGGAARTQVDAAIADFTDAVRADPDERRREVRPRAAAASDRGARNAHGPGPGGAFGRGRPSRRRRRRARERLLMTFLTPLAALVGTRGGRCRSRASLRRATARGRVTPHSALQPPARRNAARTSPRARRRRDRLLGAGRGAAGADARAGDARPHGRAGAVRLRHLALDGGVGRRRRRRRGSTAPSSAAVRCARAIPDVPSGIATLTDRVLPESAPRRRPPSFDAWRSRASRSRARRRAASASARRRSRRSATSPRGNYFARDGARRAHRRPADRRREQPGRHLRPRATRFGARRAIGSSRSASGATASASSTADGKPETAYRPDRCGRAVLDERGVCTRRALVRRERSSARRHRACETSRATVRRRPRTRRAPAPYAARAVSSLRSRCCCSLRSRFLSTARFRRYEWRTT